ncbi:hypothetical protein GCM10012286_58180 [Streptomyces lasiicapitis]|uniref:Uncharacterized protein n=1 Tax=Streptomyces lasiicapitis TaxID=1923961 RepID=A0ABQ2MJQ6_9ACTN|nr:hypothetical protein GCM10012286_58180 [Streptomyces lasiicapitis]
MAPAEAPGCGKIWTEGRRNGRTLGLMGRMGSMRQCPHRAASELRPIPVVIDPAVVVDPAFAVDVETPRIWRIALHGHG